VVFLCLVFLFFVKDYDKVHVTNCVSNIGVGREGSSCELIRHVLNFFNAGCALRCHFGVLFLFFIGFVSKALSNSLELLS